MMTYYNTMYGFVFFLSILPQVISSISIPTKFSSVEQAMNTITRPSFFKNRVLYLDTPNYSINIDLEKEEPLKEWPLTLTYTKQHKLERFPLLRSPPMVTNEIWSIDDNSIYGDVTMRLIQLSVQVTAICREIVYLEINSKVTSKHFIVPISNKVIEDDVNTQIQLLLYALLENLDDK